MLFRCFLLFFLFSTIAKSSNGQYTSAIACDSFNLEVNVRTKDTGSIRLLYFDCDDAGRTALKPLVSGQTTFPGRVNRVTEALLLTDPSAKNLDDPSVIRFIIEPGRMGLSYEMADGQPQHITIEGSLSQLEKEKWDQHILPLQRARTQKSNEIVAFIAKKKAMDTIHYNRGLEQLKKDADQLRGQLLQQSLDFVRLHPDSYFGGYLLYQYHQQMNSDSLKKYFLAQNKAVQESFFGKSVLDYLYSISDDDFRTRYNYNNLSDQLTNIKSLHDVSLIDSNGDLISLSRFKGKSVLLFFWGSWCGPCHRQAPLLQSIIEKIDTTSFQLVSVSLNTNPADWLGSMKKVNIPGFNLIDTQNILRMFYKFLAVPHYVLIDADGQLVQNNLPDPESGRLHKILVTHLAQRTGSQSSTGTRPLK